MKSKKKSTFSTNKIYLITTLVLSNILVFGVIFWLANRQPAPQTVNIPENDEGVQSVPSPVITNPETINLVPTITPATESQSTQSSSPPQPEGQANRLIHEKSPYLLQHAYNPVDWYPWGEEAFEKARRENKPIFLSIGYSTCHWCHVMEDESFEDQEVADLLNSTFVAIKVDREERPDIDSLYMDVAMMMTGSGGWPLNVMLTPELKPFFAATYIPKENRFGRTGLLELIPRVQEAWLTQNGELQDVGNQVVAALEQNANSAATGTLEPDEALLETAYQQLANRFDPQRGGFGTAPKFPSPHNLLYLLRYWDRTGDPQALEMVETTLQAMRQGGMYDQIGFGFHRYSTDAHWLVPHFEKMLYDQAMLAIAYTEAYQATGNPSYKQTAREIFTYILRDMTASNGGFYSAEDADSEGEEGKFYLWTVDELRQILSQDEADLYIAVFGATDEGNFIEPGHEQSTGANILHLPQPLADVANNMHLSKEELTARLKPINQQLFQEREGRIHPYKDDKILTDWNGLMIAALAKAAQAFDEPAYAQAASQATDFILQTMRNDDGRLLHRYRDGEAAIPANIDDYAFLTWGLLELYETDFDVRHLNNALALTEELQTHFWDDQQGGFYFTPDDGEALLVRQKEIYDGAIPSGNSVAMLNLLRLGRITANTEFEEQAAGIGHAFAASIQQAPSSHIQLISGLDFGVGPSFEVVIVGDPVAEDTQLMLTALQEKFIPNKVIVLRPPENADDIIDLADFIKYYSSLNDQATAYVCQNYYCELPTNDIDIMLELLKKT